MSESQTTTSATWSDRPRVTTSGGTVVGRAPHAGVTAFLGIPFARSSRFEPPLPTRWSGELDATEHGPICPQIPGLLENVLGSGVPPMSEDCLSLSVHVPERALAPGSNGTFDPRPVLVWIHGGAYVNGSGSAPWYDGASLARRGDVVVVSVNYRLGVFGFWRSNNLGLLDQIAALRWVRENIGAFGGDPGNVTIFGESAGGSSVVALMASPEASGLFHRVWAMSPSIGQYRTAARGEEIADGFLRAAEAEDDEALLSMSVEKLLEIQSATLATNGRAYDYFAPTFPGSGLPDDIVLAASTCPVPLVVGTTRDENRLFGAFSPEAASMNESRMRAIISALLTDPAHDSVAHDSVAHDSLVDEAIELYRRHRPGETDAQIVMAVQTDEGFRRRAVDLADGRHAAGTVTHVYWFTWPSPAFGGLLGSCHALDIPFAFHNLEQPGVTVFTGDGPERATVADAMSGEILRFAREGSVSWPSHDPDSRATFRIDLESEVVHDPEVEIRRFWERLRATV